MRLRREPLREPEARLAVRAARETEIAIAIARRELARLGCYIFRQLETQLAATCTDECEYRAGVRLAERDERRGDSGRALQDQGITPRDHRTQGAPPAGMRDSSVS